jgi:aryl-alcohol dehydrogenase-like predicted oxidoreductase
MEYRQLGRSGLTVSVLGLGCNEFSFRLDQAASTAVVDACFDAGLTLFDTSDFYGDSEVLLGKALEGRRHQAVIATKFGLELSDGRNGQDKGARGSRGYIRRAVESSLRRLNAEYIDLYQQHVPDPITPVEETLAALDELVREGKIRHAGSSGRTGWQVTHADWAARESGCAGFISAQNRYNLLERAAEQELLPACREAGVGVIAFASLANGLLSGKYRRGAELPPGARLTEMSVPWSMKTAPRYALKDSTLEVIEGLAAYAAERSITVLSVGIGGLAAQPGVSSILAGATSPAQVSANAAASSWRPSQEDQAALDAILPPKTSLL